MVQIGLDAFLQSPPAWLAECRLGLLSNSASVNHQLQHARFLINRCFPGQLRALYAPQHGFFAEKQDNMIESADGLDPQLNIPIFSLYGKTRIPTDAMFAPIDVLIVDLQDVGTRVYTFMVTLSYCLEAARRYGKKVLILDRPNPINGITVEGNILKPECSSFVGRYPIPMRHAMTVAELAKFFNVHFDIDCDLQIIPMQGWRRWMFFKDCGHDWVAPSPNLPTATSALVYAGQVLWEGTNISEGRGTTQPFELFGAPFLEPRAVEKALKDAPIAGATLRPALFEPVSNKWQGQPCHGFQIHITDPAQFESYRTTLRLLQAVIAIHREPFQWRPPPYEYEFERLPIDLLIGDRRVRRRLENLEPLDQIMHDWQRELAEFMEIRRSFLLY